LSAIDLFASPATGDDLLVGELAEAWTTLIEELRDSEMPGAVDPANLYGLLENLPAFECDGGHWIGRMHNPMESFELLINSEVGSYVYNGRSINSLFAMHVRRTATCICPAFAAQVDSVTDEWKTSLTINPSHVPSADFRNGSWILSGFRSLANMENADFVAVTMSGIWLGPFCVYLS
jgi:hypothetical protein